MSTSVHEVAAEPSPERTRRLLLITYHFPPDGAVGGLRWSGLSKYLARLGWEIDVITAAAAPIAAAAPRVHRHACARRRTLDDLYNRVVSDIRRGRRGSATAGATPTATPATSGGSRAAESQRTSILGQVRRAGRIALGFPDVGRGWVLRAGMIGRQLVREHRFDAVVTSGPPHSAHFAGVVATLGTRVPHIVDMRDPWRGANSDFPAYGMDPKWLNLLIGPFERVLFSRVRNAIANTCEFADALQQSQPQVVVTHVSNGTDVEELPRRTADRFDGISIAYVGTFYAGRSFSVVFPALESLRRDRPHDAARVKLRIAGHIDATQLAALRSALASRGIADMVEFHGPLPRPEALALLQRSHLALVLAQAQPTQIPAKLYECVGLAVPTLAITESSSATAREAHRIGALVCESDDTVGMRRLLDDLLDGRVPDSIPAAAPISYESLARQVDSVLRSAARTLRGV